MDNGKRHYLSMARDAHRPLMAVVGLMVILAVVSVGGLIVDDRILIGVPIWEKPLKFSLSFILYGAVLAMLIPLLAKGRRWAHLFGTVIAAAWIVEMTIIVGQVVRGRASHFNGETAFDALLFSIMGVTVMVLWFANLGIAILLWRHRFADRALGWSIKAGVAVSLVGTILGGIMVGPRDNLAEDIIGAHTVGLPDGGATIPFLGWSSEGGDLRIGHFVGMHALQMLPLLGLLLARWSRAVSWLSAEIVRMRLVVIAGVGYFALTGLSVWQALRGEPIHQPGTVILVAGVLLVAAVGIASTMAIRSQPVRAPESRRELTPADLRLGLGKRLPMGRGGHRVQLSTDTGRRGDRRDGDGLLHPGGTGRGSEPTSPGTTAGRTAYRRRTRRTAAGSAVPAVSLLRSLR